MPVGRVSGDVAATWRSPVLHCCLTGALLWCLSSAVNATQPVFDAHIHYSEDVWEALPPGKALQKLGEAGIHRAVVSATPAEGAERLYRADPARVVPFLRPYLSRAHRYTWHRDPAIPDWLRAQLGRIPYRGIGEFHVFGADATSPVVQDTIDIARQRGLVLMAHTDLAGIAAILARAPDTDVIWAHAGFDVPLDELQALLEAYPRLWLELSFREGIVEEGVLTPAWRRFLDAYADRCLAGTDTYTPGRWADLAGLVEETRQWLAQLPDAQASRIAHDNAARLFGQPVPPGTP
jgi:hypothetical protein